MIWYLFLFNHSHWQWRHYSMNYERFILLHEANGSSHSFQQALCSLCSPLITIKRNVLINPDTCDWKILVRGFSIQFNRRTNYLRILMGLEKNVLKGQSWTLETESLPGWMDQERCGQQKSPDRIYPLFHFFFVCLFEKKPGKVAINFKSCDGLPI